MENLINKFYETKLEKEAIDNQINELKEKSNILETTLEELRYEITKELKEKSLDSFITNNQFIAVYSEKLSTTWVNELEIKNKLKANGYDKFIKPKLTESLDKNAIKKALKIDSKLHNLIGPSIIQEPKSTAIITTVENYQKMISEIQDNSNE